MACLLTVSAFASAGMVAGAQTRQNTTRQTASQTGQTTGRNGQSVRTGSTDNRKQSGTRQATTVSRPHTTPSGAHPVDMSRKSAPEVKPSVRTSGVSDKVSTKTIRQSSSNGRQPSTATRPSTTVSRPHTTPSVDMTRQPSRPQTAPSGTRPVDMSRKPAPGVRPSPPAANSGHQVRTVEMKHPGSRPEVYKPRHGHDESRVHPRERDFMHYNAPSYFWSDRHHCYGHRVKVLPSHVVRHTWYGHVYYCFNDRWYRPYGGYYVVCRPPFGTPLMADVVAGMTWAAVNIAYYTTVAHTYDAIRSNNELIAEQNKAIAKNNETIARNNATIAAQNEAIAAGQEYAMQSYAKANELGLVQSYAAAGTEYYYQDGVFYAMGTDGQYKVIIPPAGAIVESLPEDYDFVTLGADEYYKVDDTVYKVTVIDGKPYFEVLGQLYI